MQLKQIFSKYFGQIDEDMKGSLKEDKDYQRAFDKKDVIALRKILKAINFNYKKSEEPIKTLWQANKDLFNMRQYKMDLQEYYEKFKALHKVVEELSQSYYGSPFVDIICRETNEDPSTLNAEERIALISQGEDRMLAMQLVMNADRDKYGSLIEDYDRNFLGGNN